jgi:probable rRNA maturation factor
MIAIESKYNFPSSLIERAARTALKQQGESSKANLSIVLTDNRTLRKLNRDYLGIDAPTDVLSFPASESDGSETDPETGARYLGDILISIPYARAGAQQAGNSLEAEVQLLVVHGVLHLLGHDHAKPKEKARMWKAQREILESLGLTEIQIREE